MVLNIYNDGLLTNPDFKRYKNPEFLFFFSFTFKEKFCIFVTLGLFWFDLVVLSLWFPRERSRGNLGPYLASPAKRTNRTIRRH